MTQRRGPRGTSKSRFAKLLGVSLLLHLPFTPWAALVGLIGLWSPPEDNVSSPPITAIPVDLIEDQAEAPAAPAQPEAAADNAAVGEPSALKPKPKPKPKDEPKTQLDAGAPDAADSDGGEEDAGKADASAKRLEADAGAPLADAGAPDAGAKPLADPPMAVGMKRFADANANVRLTIYTSKIRESSLGQRVGPLLRSLYQWRDFFGPTAIDPIRDIDQIMIVGPQLRDSSNVIAILQHHVPASRMHTAVDALVRADHAGGTWLDAPVPAASAHADGAERRFVLINPTTVIVAPPSAYAGVIVLGSKGLGNAFHLAPAQGPEAALIYLATPWRAFIGWPVKVPESIKWARVRITPTADGGATAELEAEDENEDKAREDAASLTRTAIGLSQLNLGLLGSLLGQQTHKFIEHVSFDSNGKVIHGEARITADQLSAALDMAGAFLADRQARHERAAAPASSPR